ncbi:MAG: sigma-70 family RNA polymerase sigma factor [Chloroflexi bacterium]|nr:sigma-70 family RNA polymerase sigma factor [Chloroflexota bacterium]
MALTVSFLQHLSDEELVVGALLGHIGAFDEIVRRFRTAVILVAQGIVKSREAAEDVAQETFLAAYKALPQLDHPSSLPSWLCAIARHRALRVAEREGRSEATEESVLDALLLEQSQELQPDPCEEALRRIEAAFLYAALSRLPPDLATVLHLYYYDDWSVSEIGAFLSLPTTTVKWRLHQGRQTLRKQLAQTEETHDDRRDHSKHPAGSNDSPPGKADARPDGAECQKRQHDRRSKRRRPSRHHSVQCGAAVS